MTGLGVGVAAAITILVAALAALVAGLAMVVVGLVQLNKSAKLRKAETRLIEEQDKAVKGLANEYRAAAEEAEALGFTISDAMSTHIRVTEISNGILEEAVKLIRGLDNEYVELLKELGELGIVLTEEQTDFIILTDLVEALNEEMSKGGKANLDLVAQQIIAIEDMGHAVSEETQAWLSKQEVIAGVNAELNEQIRLQDEIAGLTQGLVRQVTGGKISSSLMGLFQARAGLDIAGNPVSPEEADRLAEFYQRQLDKERDIRLGAQGVEGFAHGGDILGPTLLTSLATGRPYAVAGEAGPEKVVQAGGANHMTVEAFGEPMLDILGENMVARIRTAQGLNA